jgi:predicted RNA-binding protein YlqC (UPF0109 family)
MRDLLTTILKEFVEHPDDVQIEETVVGKQTLITIKVHANDTGKIVGKDGSTIHALRRIAKVVGARRKQSYIVDLSPTGR